MLGFWASTFGIAKLGDLRPGWIPSLWHEVAYVAFFASWAWYLWVTFPVVSQLETALQPSKSKPHYGAGVCLFLAFAGTFLARWQWSEAWAVVFVGPCAGAILWFTARIQNSKPYLAVAVWSISGAAVLPLQWPNPQRFLAALIAGGVATAVQGAFAFYSFNHKLRRKVAEGR